MISHALVLAAGKSTRIASVAGGRPKPLLPIGGRPVIAHTLAWLRESGIPDVWINLHHRPGEIRAALGDGSAFGVRIHYADEPDILGTAGAFRALADRWTDTTLVVYGDNLVRFDLAAFHRVQRTAGCDAMLAVFDPDTHANSRIAGGRVALEAGGRVTTFLEGGARTADGGAGYVNAGVYLLEPGIAASVGPGLQDFGRDVFPALVRSGRLFGYVMEPSGYCIGLDTPDSYRAAEELVGANAVTLA